MNRDIHQLKTKIALLIYPSCDIMDIMTHGLQGVLLANLGSYDISAFGVNVKTTAQLWKIHNPWTGEDDTCILTNPWSRTYAVDQRMEVSSASDIEILEHVLIALKQYESFRNPMSNKRLISVVYEYIDSVLTNMTLRLEKSFRSIDKDLLGAIKKYINVWGLENLPTSWMTLETILDQFAHHVLLEKKAKTIQRAWREAIANPYHPICQRRLLWEYSQFLSE